MSSDTHSRIAGTSHSRRASPGEKAEYYLTPFDPLFAPLVASWVQSDQELTWLAPGTVPPLTTRKVMSWDTRRNRRYLFWDGVRKTPVGYAELNDMPSQKSQLWIGHFVLDPKQRRKGYAGRFAQALVGIAFETLDAREVVLVVFPENQGAIRAYERSGLAVIGEERKFFKTTQREHTFLRMSIRRSRYRKLVAARQLPSQPLQIR